MRMREVCLLLTCLLVPGLSSCVLQTAPALATSAESRPCEKVKSECSFYRVGDAYYMALRAKYVRAPRPIQLVFVAGHGKPGMSLVQWPEKEEAEETLYVLLTAEMVHKCLGLTVTEPPKTEPQLIRENKWEAAAAQLCQSKTSIARKRVSVRGNVKLAADEAACRYKDGGLEVELPYRLGWDAAYKYPMAVALWAGVDVPCSIALNGALVVGGCAYVLMAPVRQSQPLPESDRGVVAPIVPQQGAE